MAGHKESKGSFDYELDTDSDLSHSEKKQSVSDLLEQGKELREREEYEEGIDTLLEALGLGVNKDEVYYRLGNTFYDAGDLDRAEYSYERAVEENEKHVNAQHNLAVVYKDQGKIDKSIKQRKKANKIEMKNPKDPDLSEEGKNFARRFALKLFFFLTLGITGIGGLIYLVSRFFF
ncbi:tetratricopeptide repeat protein [Candidatus Bipolaricaulota bacterium]|nr:tetratricopeptide repeat protein [Candidatus Bipolaricaulota bacterium]